MLPPPRQRIPHLLALALLFGLVPTIAAAQASFDCARATTWAEHAICTTPALADLDLHIAGTYSQLRFSLPEEAPELRDDQRRWLATRDACETEQVPLTCLEETMAFRLLQLDSRLIVEAPPSCEETLAADETTFIDRYSLSTLSTVSALRHRATCLRWRTTDRLLAAGASEADLEAFDAIRDGLYRMLSAWYQFDTLASGGGTMFQIFLADRSLDTEAFLAELADLDQAPTGEAASAGLRRRLSKQADFLHGRSFEILFEETDDTRTQWRQAQADHEQGYRLALAAVEGRSDTFAFQLLLYLDRTMRDRQDWLELVLGD